eukprot:TRINITY_DN4841_c0_g1_i11.p1 TRINITY_DN4841_c0_g1~~TRINITY_DN4841_c0_g1_i11.p1  ORF type:complete len:1175 (+),score=287.71 TRINITY_DN4841_c0_g1_i11:93-3617(+)
MAPQTAPRVFPGPMTRAGKEGNRAGDPLAGVGMTEGCDWNHGRLCAYAHFTMVVVVDPGSNQVVTVLDRHAEDVSCVRFVGTSSKGVGEVYLASGDEGGKVNVWDVSSGVVVASASCNVSNAAPPYGKVVSIRVLRREAADGVSHGGLPFRLVCVTPITVLLMDLATHNVLWRVDLGNPVTPLAGLAVSPRHDAIAFTTDSTLAILHDVASKAAGRNVKCISVAWGGGALQHVEACPSVRHHVYLAFQTEVVLYNTHVQQRIDTFHIRTPRTEFRGLFAAPSAEAHALTSVLGLSGPGPIFTLGNDGSLSAWVGSGDGGGGLQARPVDCRSSRQGYAGRPFLVAMERCSAAGVVCGKPHLLARFAVVTNDGAFSVWECTIDGWVLASSLAGVPGAVACAAVMDLVPPLRPSFSTDAYDVFPTVHTRRRESPPSPDAAAPSPHIVLITTTGTLQVLCVGTGRVLAKADIMTEKGTEPLSVHAVNPTSFLVAAVRTVPKAAGDEGCNVNYIALMRVSDCGVAAVLKGHRAEVQKLCAVGVSPTRRYITALHCAQGQQCLCEVWDLETRIIVSRISLKETHAGPGIISWAPLRPDHESGAVPSHDDPQNAFVWLLPDFSITYHRVSTGRKGPVALKQWLVNGKNRLAMGMLYPPTAADWYDRVLVLGDASGTIGVVNIQNEKFSMINSQQRKEGGVQQLAVCPKEYMEAQGRRGDGDEGDGAVPNCYAAVLFETGDFGIWNVALKQNVSKSDRSGREMKATSVAWAPGPHPVICTPQGTVEILALTLATGTAPVPSRRFTHPLLTPACLPTPCAAYLDTCIMIGHAPAWLRETRNIGLVSPAVWALLDDVPDSKPASIIQRCFVAAAVRGDEDRMQFWRAVEVAFGVAEACTETTMVHPSVQVRREERGEREPPQPPDTVLDETPRCAIPAADELLLNNTLLHAVDTEANAAMERSVRQHKATDQYDVIAEQHVRLGAINPACQLLLDTPRAAPEWRGNLYKACTLAAGLGQQQYRRMAARVASLFISHGDVDSAVELLCLTGCVVEACHAYQAAGRWEDAARLAKVALPGDDAFGVLSAWAQYLAATSPLAGAAVLASTKNFAETVRYLLAENEVAAAGLLAAAAHAFIDDASLLQEACRRYLNYLHEDVECPDAAARFHTLVRGLCGAVEFGDAL